MNAPPLLRSVTGDATSLATLSPSSAEVGARSLKTHDPLYYNSLLDRHTRRCYMCKRNVKNHLVGGGFLSREGVVYPSREELTEANRFNRLRREQEEMLREVERREAGRLRRLKRAAGVGEVMFTSDGVVELKPCRFCGNPSHVVPPLMCPREVCPGSLMAVRGHYPPNIETRPQKGIPRGKNQKVR